MDKGLYESYLRILRSELVPALGCTEPIAVAYAAARARKLLGAFPEKVEMYCSGNIIKNVKGVVVPNSSGQRGIETAALLGVIGGDESRKLEVLESVTKEDQEEAKKKNEAGLCKVFLAEGVANLYIRAVVSAAGHSAEVVIEDYHTNIVLEKKDGEVLFQVKELKKAEAGETPHISEDKARLDVKDILTFADELNVDDVKEVFDRQIAMNTAISQEGLKHHYGADVGKVILKNFGSSVRERARAAAAAGSDARMGGCSLPVVINSGSGNQGMTCSLPVIEYAKELGVSREKLYRALAVSNLISIHQKKYIGSLSAYCGAVSAACGAGAAITYLYGGTYDDISRTITNTIANVGGIVCDGAKSSCAAKIAASVEAAILAHLMSFEKRVFQPGEGLVQEDVEGTIESIGRVGREGMKSTDIEILNIMIGC